MNKSDDTRKAIDTAIGWYIQSGGSPEARREVDSAIKAHEKALSIKVATEAWEEAMSYPSPLKPAAMLKHFLREKGLSDEQE